MSCPGGLFDRVVVGVDGSSESVEACRQGARLVEPHGLLELVSAFDPAPVVRAGWNSVRAREELEGSAQAALDLGHRVVGEQGRTALLNGDPARTLLRELARLDATLAVVGSCGHSRVSQAILGGVAVELLQRAPCSVLVARPPTGEHSFPGTIVVGVDDSACSERALAAARSLERRFGASVRVVAASRAKALGLRREHPGLSAVEFAYEPADALVAASAGVDLLVLGRRGRRGLEALLGVSGRVVHRATSSVLVVR